MRKGLGPQSCLCSHTRVAKLPVCNNWFSSAMHQELLSIWVTFSCGTRPVTCKQCYSVSWLLWLFWCKLKLCLYSSKLSVEQNESVFSCTDWTKVSSAVFSRFTSLWYWKVCFAALPEWLIFDICGENKMWFIILFLLFLHRCSFIWLALFHVNIQFPDLNFNMSQPCEHPVSVFINKVQKRRKSSVFSFSLFLM